jgi:hypothetical protein
MNDLLSVGLRGALAHPRLSEPGPVQQVAMQPGARGDNLGKAALTQRLAHGAVGGKVPVAVDAGFATVSELLAKNARLEDQLLFVGDAAPAVLWLAVAVQPGHQLGLAVGPLAGDGDAVAPGDPIQLAAEDPARSQACQCLVSLVAAATECLHHHPGPQWVRLELAGQLDHPALLFAESHEAGHGSYSDDRSKRCVAPNPC